ncbi:hypothetical protein C3K47_08975 [Solitalea longa]|uniref:Uncharacterized protein n=1 Tax=Solitalea longa TaxID=2079460 RepID=A0A2S5A4F9_9SPHI|nr:hypothetical protein [Solitalea longa]POY37177.1 hypothetical protein C3K47_08975 [Solitalea longa]
MGLDIHIGTNNHEELYSAEYYDEKNGYFNKHSLSRTFCNFMCRQNVVGHEPELDQIGKITGVDILPIYELESYPEEEGLEFFIETAESEEERQRILGKAEEDKAKLQGNIDQVIKTITELIEKLNSIDNLPSLLLPTNYDSLNNQEYFADFKVDKGQGYIDNNFGQDLRNFNRFLEFAKERGTTTIWFNYG